MQAEENVDRGGRESEHSQPYMYNKRQGRKGTGRLTMVQILYILYDTSHLILPTVLSGIPILRKHRQEATL